MKSKIFLFILIFISGKNYAQTNKKKNVPPKLNYTSNKCYKVKNLSSQKRLANFPFNIAQKIQLVAFNYEYDQSNYLFSKSDTTLRTHVPMNIDTLVFSNIISMKELNDNQKDSLTDILYNYDSKSNINQNTKVGCYYPHNGIIFLDSANKVLEFVELCFSCKQIRTSNEKIKLGYFCEGKYEMLIAYFRSIGIQYGINKETPKNPKRKN